MGRIFLEGITWIFYHIFWLLPLYVINLILNMTTVTEVAEDTFKVVGYHMIKVHPLVILYLICYLKVYF